MPSAARCLSGGGSLSRPSEFLADLPRHLLDGSPLTLANLNKAQSVESQTRWDDSPSSVSRLEQDLKSNTVTPSDSKIRSKIIPFPVSNQATIRRHALQSRANVSHPRFGRGKVIGVRTRARSSAYSLTITVSKKIFADAEGFKVIPK